MIKSWLIRLACCIPLLMLLALTVKWKLIEPYSINVVNFDVEPEPVAKKGDREI